MHVQNTLPLSVVKPWRRAGWPPSRVSSRHVAAGHGDHLHRQRNFPSTLTSLVSSKTQTNFATAATIFSRVAPRRRPDQVRCSVTVGASTYTGSSFTLFSSSTDSELQALGGGLGTGHRAPIRA